MRVKVEVSNRLARMVGDYPRERLIPFWSYGHPNWYFMRKKFAYYDVEAGEVKYRWDGRKEMIDNDGMMSAGLFWATRHEIESKTGIKFEVVGDLEWPAKKTEGNIVSEGEWAFQNTCVEKMVRVSGYGGGLVVNATGTGKTRTAGMLFSRLSGKHCFVVDQLLLMEQAISDLTKELGEKIGMVGNSKFDPQRVTVATVQTMHRHRQDGQFKRWTRELDTIIIDEIHEQMNHRNFSVVEQIEPKAVYGLTATLQLKKKHVRVRAWSLAGPVIYEFPLTEGQKAGVLSNGIAVQVLVRNHLDVSEQADMIAHLKSDSKAWGHFYNEMIVNNANRNKVMERIIRKARDKGRFTAALVTRVEHLKQLADRLPDVPHRVMAGMFRGQHVDIKDRMKFKSKFEEGKIRVILANVVMKKGVSINRLDVVVDGAAGSNPNDPIQKFGRGIRLHEEKDGLLYFDISDNDENKYNWFMKAAKRRAKALKAAGIPVFKFWWNADGTEDELWEFAETKLREVLHGNGNNE